MELSKETASTRTQRAREAQKQRRWAEAETLWRELLSERPGDRSVQLGLGTLLLARGRLDEARAIALTLRKYLPNDTAGLTLGARIAVEEEDWLTAADLWRAVLTVKGDVAAALTGVGNCLLAMSDFTGAEKWEEQLTGRFPGHPYGVALSARIAAARGDQERAIDLWHTAARRFPQDAAINRELCRALLDAGQVDEAEAVANTLLRADREGALLQLGNVLVRRQPDDDHTDFWNSAHAEFPENMTFLRREALCAMKAGRADDAIDAMGALFSGADLSLSDAALVVGLVHILAARDEPAALRRSVRAYLKGLNGSGSYRLAALRLSRVIFAHFAAHDSRRRLSYNERTRRMVDRAPLKPKPRQLLERSLALENALAARTSAMFDTDVSRSECLAFVAHIHDRVARREPFSFVRINDAESNAFPYEPHLASHFAADADEREQVWWGRGMSPADRAAMSERVAEAAWHADAIGIPTFARILRDLHLQQNADLSFTRTGRGLRAVLAAFERFSEFRPAGLAPPIFASANLHQDLQRWNLYGALFEGAGEIVLVSCHPDLPEAMKRTFGVGVSANIVVPPRHASIHLMVKRANTPHILPEVIDDMVAEVRAQAPGRMVVVGAGYLGKWIVHQAKLAGGIALDLGSVLDYWVGLKTRSYQDLA